MLRTRERAEAAGPSSPRSAAGWPARSLTIWQAMPTPHLSAFAAAIASSGLRVRFVSLSALDPARRARGWAEADAPGAEILRLGGGDPRAVLTGHDGDADLHLLPGLKPTSWLVPVQRALWPTPARILIVAESAQPRTPLAASAVRWRDRALAWRWRRRAMLMLAMGEIGCAHYRAAGFPECKLREFAYWPALGDSPVAASPPGEIHFVFAGSLVPRKGLDLLIEALGRCADRAWTLGVIGDGARGPALRRRAQVLGIADRIVWHGPVQGSRVPALLAAADRVVVPSRFDGWGAVTNEALGVGVPVIASDRCASATVLRDPSLGAVFAADSVAALARCLDQALRAPRLTPADRAAIASWARRFLSPEAGATYLRALVCGEAVAPPWRSAPPPGTAC